MSTGRLLTLRAVASGPCRPQAAEDADVAFEVQHLIVQAPVLLDHRRMLLSHQRELGYLQRQQCVSAQHCSLLWRIRAVIMQP